MLGETHLQKLLDRILSKSQADETEVLFLGLEEALTRFANNEIHQNVAETNFGIVIRVAQGKRVAAVSTTDSSDEGIDRALAQVNNLVKFQPENPDFLGFTQPGAELSKGGAYDEATATASAELRARSVGETINYAQAQGINAFGALRTACYEWCLANSHGIFAYNPNTLADLVIVAMTENSSGYADEASWKVGSIDVAARGREAVDKALRSKDPRPFEAGEYPVVLEPYATMDILNFVGMSSGAQNVHEGRSWMSGRQGQKLMHAAITISDDPQDPHLWPLPFDFEGMPRLGASIVKAGVTGDAVSDRTWAKKMGLSSTGNAVASFNPFSPSQAIGGFGPMPLHLRLEAGDTPVSEMIKSIERGLYVTRFNYTRPVHPRELVVTGLTRDGTFLIENGKISHPVHNLRFTQSYVEALNQVRFVGDTPQTGRSYMGFSRAPALCLENFRFTGTTNF